jgi:signal transduction histidine kinase
MFPLEVVTATDLASALRRLAEDRVDVILLDLDLSSEQELPALETLEACAPAVPVLLFRDRPGRADAAASLPRGAADCLCGTDLTGDVLYRGMRRAIERAGAGRTAAEADPSAPRAPQSDADPCRGDRGLAPPISRLAPVTRMASVGQLAGGVAHEVNNLLCALSNQLQVLQLRDDLAPDLVASVEAMEAWVRRAADRVGSLLEYALRPQGTRSRVDVQAVTRQMVDLLRGSSRLRQLELCTEFAPALPPLDLDTAAWEHLVFEVVANAAEAISAKGSLWIRARALPTAAPTAPPAAIEISFADDGPGISADHLPRVFEPFFTTRDASRHLGLGLTLVRSIVLAHQGEIGIEANHPTGSRIVIRLPVPEDPPASSDPDEP